jgi:aminoglycoside phosphotransferase (APT) family kinase protein
MESKTKVKLTQTEIQQLVDYAFGNKPIASVCEMKDGWFNAAYHITLTDKTQTVLKVGPPAASDILSYEKDLLRAEVETMQLVSINPEIPVPNISCADFSRSRLPYDYYFMDFVTDKTWHKIRDTLSDAQNNAIEFQLGQMTKQINAFEHTAFGYYAFGQEFDNWPDAFRWMCQLLFDDAKRYDVALDLSEQEFFDKFDEHRAIFAEVTQPQLVHWDLWAGNIFVAIDDDVPTISSIVDFERALWGDPLMEFYPGHLTGISHYIDGYGEDILATQAQRLRRIFYNIYLLLIMIIEDGPRQYDDKSSVVWAKERLPENIAMLRHGDVISSSMSEKE